MFTKRRSNQTPKRPEALRVRSPQSQLSLVYCSLGSTSLYAMIRTQQALPSAGSLLSSQTDCFRISADSSSLECHQTTNLVLGRSHWPTYPGIRRKDLPFPVFCAARSPIQGIESRTLRFSDLQRT